MFNINAVMTIKLVDWNNIAKQQMFKKLLQEDMATSVRLPQKAADDMSNVTWSDFCDRTVTEARSFIRRCDEDFVANIAAYYFCTLAEATHYGMHIIHIAKEAGIIVTERKEG